jgi:hypothetical protein
MAPAPRRRPVAGQQTTCGQQATAAEKLASINVSGLSSFQPANHLAGFMHTWREYSLGGLTASANTQLKQAGLVAGAVGIIKRNVTPCGDLVWRDVKPMRCGRRLPPKNSVSHRENYRPQRERLGAVEVNILQTAGCRPHLHADVLLVPVEVPTNVGVVDPEKMPILTSNRFLAAEFDRNRIPVAVDILLCGFQNGLAFQGLIVVHSI